MKILWFTWKDRKNPLAGGAEVVNEGLAKKLVENGHEVILLVAGFRGALNEEFIDGYKVIRLGNKWTVYWQSYKYYKRHLVGWADLIIDEINTVPFFCKLYVKEKNIILCYQLCREIWFYQMFFPLSLIGYMAEPLYLWLLRKQIVLTESESTKKDMQNYGFKKDKIHVFSVGIEIAPVKDLDKVHKFEKPTILVFGAIKATKRTDHVVRAFEIAKEKIINLQLVMVGSTEGEYGAKVLKMIKTSKYKDSIEYLGRVDTTKKIELMQKSHLIGVTSVKEGWGLIVTEAGSQGTPSVVYDVDGLRDAVEGGLAGYICNTNPRALAETIVHAIKDKNLYDTQRINAWIKAKATTLDIGYRQFLNIVGIE